MSITPVLSIFSTAVVVASLAIVSAGVPRPADAQTVGATESQFADWNVTCPSGNRCVAMHSTNGARLVAGPGGKDGGMRFAVLIAANAGRGTPVGLRTSNGTVVQLRTQRCSDGFCEAAASPKAVPQILDNLRRADQATVAYPTNGAMVFSDVSFDGLRQALQRAEER